MNTPQKQCFLHHKCTDENIYIIYKKDETSSTVQNMLQHIQAIKFDLNLDMHFEGFCMLLELRPKAEHEARFSKTRQHQPSKWKHIDLAWPSSWYLTDTLTLCTISHNSVLLRSARCGSLPKVLPEHSCLLRSELYRTCALTQEVHCMYNMYRKGKRAKVPLWCIDPTATIWQM